MKRGTVPAVAALLLVAMLLASPFVAADLEGFEEPEAKPARAAAGADGGPAAQESTRGAHGSAASRTSSSTSGPKVTPQVSLSGAFGSFDLKNRYLEAVAAVGILVYVAVFVLGVLNNKARAEAWAKAYAMPGGLLDRNFSQLGGKGLLMRDSPSLFKLYASGRRHCQGLLAEVQLMPRQDLLSMLWCVIFPSEDTITIDVFMHEASMPPLVVVVATPKVAKALQRDAADVQRFTKKINASKDMPAFADDKLWVLAEHSGIVHDLFLDKHMQQQLSFGGPNGPAMRYFHSLHFSDVKSGGKHKQVLRFVFKLPPAKKMDVVAPLMDLVPHFIDLVGTYKLSPDLKKRATDARTKQLEQDDEVRRKRQEALINKKIERAEAEKAKLARMTPEARAKAKEKMERAAMKKAMNKKTVKA